MTRFQQLAMQNLRSTIVRVSPKMDSPTVATNGAALHAVDMFDGVVGRRLQCVRFLRLMPEDSYARVGHSHNGRHPVALLHPCCHTCRKQSKGKWTKHPEYSAKLDRFWTRRLSQIKATARGRGLLVSIDKDDLLGKYIEQDGYCAISGLKMEPFGANKFKAPSVDRIDSAGNYTLDNVQIVLQAVNIMKGELPQDVFLQLCGTIANRSLSVL